MSQHSSIKHVTATLAAAACLAFASGVGAANVNDENAFANSPSSACHPAYLPCQKEAPRPVTTRSASADTVYIAVGEFDYVPFGSACHPAYRPCGNWSLRVERSAK